MRVAIAILCALLVGASAQSSEKPAQALFVQNCAICHGPAAEGHIGPQLAGRNLDAAAFRERVRHGGRAMPAFDQRQLSDVQVNALLAFVNSLPAPTADAASAPLPKAAGAKPFADNCAMCHGPEGRGAMGPGVLNTPIGFDAFKEQVRKGSGAMPPFPQMSDSDIAAMYAWLHPPLRSRPDPGRVVHIPHAPNYTLASAVFVLLIVLFTLFAIARRNRREAVQAKNRAEWEPVARKIESSDPQHKVRARVL